MSKAQVHDPSLAAALKQAGLDSVDGAFAFGGGTDFNKPGLGTRRRTKLTLTDDQGRPRELFLKRYGAQSLSKRLARWLGLSDRRSTAAVEFDAVVAVQAAGVPTMEAVACGHEHPLKGRSYVIVSAVEGQSLEKCGAEFCNQHAPGTPEMNMLTDKLAEVARKLHSAGLVHRDFYASHVFLHRWQDGIGLNLIDLARVFRPRWRRFRWFVKDLAAIKFSMPAQWVQHEWPSFLRKYLGQDRIQDEARWSKTIDRKVNWMNRRANARQISTAAG